ncbi:hypothetical protein HZB02_07405 [Candidatus Woesearchaeota archaeon]|nr:hypothetical protein [Candidatus Woesearchaeota archaeon]
MKFTQEGIILQRELSDLDLFTLEFVRVLRKFTPYVVVSGYVAILLGRARASEDVDVIIPPIEKPVFTRFLEELTHAGFDCMNTGNLDEMFSYLHEKISLRFVRTGMVIPNIEMKFSKNKADEISLKQAIIVNMNNEELRISPLEMQIAFKEVVLGSPKDMEDARHLRNIAKGHLEESKIENYMVMLHRI